jgi:hypothetical protein
MHQLPIDRQQLILALTSNFDSFDAAFYLDRETGELILVNEDIRTIPDHGIPDDIEDNPRYLVITPFPSFEIFPIRKDFIDTLEPGEIADHLAKMLSGKKPFRRFKDALYDFPGLPDQWFQFEEAALTRKAMAWCKDNDIKVIWIENGSEKKAAD